VKAIIEKAGIPSAIVDSRECITSRQLLERTVSQCLDALADSGAEFQQLPRCDSISALHVRLETILRAQEKFILVFDGIDKQRDAPPTLLPALARLGEYVGLYTIQFSMLSANNPIDPKPDNRIHHISPISASLSPTWNPSYSFPAVHQGPDHRNPVALLFAYLPHTHRS
jgi:hypothetical protein